MDICQAVKPTWLHPSAMHLARTYCSTLQRHLKSKDAACLCSSLVENVCLMLITAVTVLMTWIIDVVGEACTTEKSDSEKAPCHRRSVLPCFFLHRADPAYLSSLAAHHPRLRNPSVEEATVSRADPAAAYGLILVSKTLV